MNHETKSEILYQIKYSGYLERELRNIEKLKKLESFQIPSNIDYFNVAGLKKESAEKLFTIKPGTLGQASRISGVNPADISVLMIMIPKLHNL